MAYVLGSVVVGISSAPAASAATLSCAASKKARKKRNDLDISKKRGIQIIGDLLENLGAKGLLGDR